MKKIISMTLFLLLTNAANADQCSEMLTNHMQTIQQSESKIEVLKSKLDISSYEIAQLQKNLTDRFVSLKNLLNEYKREELNCTPKVMSEAVAAYDMTLIGQGIFANNNLRRIVNSFTKYKGYKLTDLTKVYKKYSAGDTIERIQREAAAESVEIPKEIILDANRPDHDRNLYKISDRAIKGTTSIVAGAARVWGFISDRLKWRQGRLKDNAEIYNEAKAKLKPLDILFEKRTFTLSNYTIPGHFGHSAVWLGTKDELIALGIWDQEFFKPFREHVETGHNIVEIRKEGINYQTLESFLNLDEFAITRIEGIESRALTVFKELSDQIDKKYDFKFDSHSLDKITCAELISFSYGDIKWHETKTLFQYSLRPDDLAVLTLDETSPEKFIMYARGTKDEILNLGFEDWKKALEAEMKVAPEEKVEQELNNDVVAQSESTISEHQ